MQAVMTRAAERKFAGVRLAQAAYHNRSLSLYAKLGFSVSGARHGNGERRTAFFFVLFLRLIMP